MKKNVITMLMVFMSLSQAHATSGVDCQSIDGTLEVSTEEAIDSSQNTVLSMRVVAPWIQADPITFMRSKNQITLSTEEGVVYMGSNDQGQQVTMTLSQDVETQVTSGTVYLKNQDVIYTDQIVCF